MVGYNKNMCSEWRWVLGSKPQNWVPQQPLAAAGSDRSRRRNDHKLRDIYTINLRDIANQSMGKIT